MSNMGFILLMSDVDGIVYMILGLFFILTISYGIGCLGRKRKIGFGWAFFISLFLNPLIGLIVVLCSKEKRMDDWQESDSGIDEAVMHREGNIKWEEISKVMRDGKNPSGTQEAIEAHKISHSETYESLYMELLDKCNPRNFIEPYDKKKVDAAILIYDDLSRIDKTNEKHMRVIRDRATLELGINVSTDRLYKELIDYCNPQNFLTTVPFQADLLQAANHFYAEVRANKNDIHELERLSSQIYASKVISLFYEKRRRKEEEERRIEEEDLKEREAAANRAMWIIVFLVLIIIGVVALVGMIFV